MVNGKLIVIEGLDGSGKGTQSTILANRLAEMGIECKKVTFPDYEGKAAGALTMYLNGEFGKDPSDVNAFAASTFFAVDRFSSYKRVMKPVLDNGGVIVCDRYTTSNAIHQMSKLPEEEWQPFIDWLYDFEFNKLGLPKPDAVIYLSMNVNVSQRLIEGRYEGTSTKKDIHEANVAYLNTCKKAAQYCADNLGWTTVLCSDDENPFTIDEISNKVLEVLQKESIL